MKEIKLETGTLRVTRNAELLMAITLGGTALLGTSPSEILLPAIGCYLVVTLGKISHNELKFLNENKDKYDTKTLRNKTFMLSDENLKYHFEYNSALLALNTVLTNDLIAESIKTEHNVPGMLLAGTSLLSTLTFVKSSYLYHKLISQTQEDTVEQEKVKKLN